MVKIKVYANKVYRPANVVTDDIIYLGDIEADSFPVAFIKTLRLYNKNANRGIVYPTFTWKGKTYSCDYIGEQSKRGVHRMMTVHQYNPKTGAYTNNQYILTIPKSKINSPDWRYYLE